MNDHKVGQCHPEQVDDVIDLVPSTDERTGRLVWGEEGASLSKKTDTASNVIVRDGQLIELGSAVEGVVLGHVAQGRMAGSGWDAIDQYFAQEEEGRPTGLSLEARPGGELVLVDKHQADETQIGHAAQGRMAALNPKATPAEMQEIRRIDPTNIEQWTPKEFGTLRGLEFRFRSRLPKPSYFKFLVLKTGNDEWRIAPLHPNMDDLFGHRHHMVSRTIGGVSVPIICGPGGRAATSLKEARDFAYKWSAYIEGLLSGRLPKQSK